jgi:hypothetical protein
MKQNSKNENNSKSEKNYEKKPTLLLTDEIKMNQKVSSMRNQDIFDKIFLFEASPVTDSLPKKGLQQQVKTIPNCCSHLKDYQKMKKSLNLEELKKFFNYSILHSWFF